MRKLLSRSGCHGFLGEGVVLNDQGLVAIPSGVPRHPAGCPTTKQAALSCRAVQERVLLWQE